jgi:hypothetical protein
VKQIGWTRENRRRWVTIVFIFTTPLLGRARPAYAGRAEDQAVRAEALRTAWVDFSTAAHGLIERAEELRPLLIRRKELWDPAFEATRNGSDDHDRLAAAAIEYDNSLADKSSGLISRTELQFPPSTDVDQARTLIASAVTKLLDQTNPLSCLAREAPTQSCRERIESRCSSVRLRKGSLSRLVVTSGFELQETGVANSDEFRDHMEGEQSVVGDLDFALCYWAAGAGLDLEQASIKLPEQPEWVDNAYEALSEENFAATMLKICKAESQESIEAFRRLERLEKQLPAKSFERSTVRHWRQMGKPDGERCRRGFAYRCSSVYFVRGTPVLSYVTAGCRVRDVTSGDVDADAEKMDTEASRLRHSQLKDLIDFCDSARGEGFSWPYVRPTLKHCVRAP